MSDQQNLPENKLFIEQITWRQENINKQVLEAVQQAMSVLVMVQQQLTSELSFLQKLREDQSYGQLIRTGELDTLAQNTDEAAPWVASQPPELQ